MPAMRDAVIACNLRQMAGFWVMAITMLSFVRL